MAGPSCLGQISPVFQRLLELLGVPTCFYRNSIGGEGGGEVGFAAAFPSVRHETSYAKFKLSKKDLTTSSFKVTK